MMSFKDENMAEFLYENLKEGEPKIVYNALRTPDGTIIESKYRYDCKFYLDQNGKEYMVDGGLDYIHSSAHGDEEYLTLTIDDDHERVRDFVTWGTYGIDGKQPLTFVRLKDMDTDHIKKVLETQAQMRPALRIAMQNELDYREKLNGSGVS